MKVGITGLPASGKTTVFQALTRGKVSIQPFGSSKPNVGVVNVPDARVDYFAKQYNPKNSNSFKEGASEHQTGLAISISSRVTDDFAKSTEKKWLDTNAYKYGFIYRFPSNKEEITGFSGTLYQYRYVGIDAAKVIYDNKLTLEEYYATYIDVK